MYKDNSTENIIIIVVLTLLVIGVVISLTKKKVPQGAVVPEKEFATPTPTATPVPIENLNRRDPKEDHKFILEVKASYENVTDINVRSNPWKTAGLVTTVKVGDKFNVACIYSDPEKKDFLGFDWGDLGGLRGEIVWIYGQYCKIHEEIEPWAVSTYDFNYSEAYGRSKVTIRQKDGNVEANVRSEPWESENSSYGTVRVGSNFIAGIVYVSEDKQWYGFPYDALPLPNMNKDPDGIVWIYSPYCLIDPQ